MTTNNRVHAWIRISLSYGQRLMSILLLCISLGIFTKELCADTWTGAGQISATQNRDWVVPGNWAGNAVPAGQIDRFTLTGDGSIAVLGNQSAGGLVFEDFTATKLYPDPLVSGTLILVNEPGGGAVPPKIRTGETLRDTYGVDYYTTGPELAVNLQLNAPPKFELGNLGVGAFADKSAMMVSGTITPGGTIDYNGWGTGTSLWITGNSTLNGNTNINVNSGGGGGGTGGYILHLADNGRLNQAIINLNSSKTYLGLHDTQNNPALLQNTIHSYQADIFADRSYQQNDLNNSINVLQTITGMVQIHQFNTKFGGTGTFGRTNNGYSLRVSSLKFTETSTVEVNNGNLTEDRAGSRYVSGANRLQEAHNYTYVANLQAVAQPLTKSGTGVLAIERVYGGGIWLMAPTVQAGVLRLGIPGVAHTIPGGQGISLNQNGGVGFGWDTTINLNASVPLSLWVSSGVPGQSGAVDPDLWNFLSTVANPLINTNINSISGKATHLRIGSSKGGDASFDPQPLAAKHASIAFTNNQIPPQMTQIIPYVIGPNECNIYYFGGGGGTLRVDAQLNDYQDRNTMLEMGTTGTLLPGRVALNPGGEGIGEVNTYTGGTEICAGTLQLMKQGSVYGSQAVSVWTYDSNITNALYANPSPYHHPLWEGAGNYTWTGPGQLLLDPGRDIQLLDPKDWSLNWYQANGGGPLFNALTLDGGVIGWTSDVNLAGVPGIYGQTISSNLTPDQLGNPKAVNVLGLGGEYSAGTMFWRPQPQIGIGDNQETPVLLYKAGKNSKLDLTQNQGIANTYTGGTIITGGEIIVNDANQLNAHVGNQNGGPIAILNGGRLHITPGSTNTNFVVPIKINTSGTPDTVKNCGSVIEVDANVTATLSANFDFSWAPTRYLEKEGQGTLVYAPAAPVTPGAANAWGLKLTNGRVEVNQLPVNPGSDSGPVIFNNGNLQVTQAPVGVATANQAYGFRNIVSFKNTSSTVDVDDNTLFRTHGIVPNEIVGTVNFQSTPGSDNNPNNNIVHLSRNMVQTITTPTLGDYSCGNGAMTFTGVTVYMTGGGLGNQLNVLPRDAGFILQLNDGVVFNASSQNNVYGEVNFNNLTPADPTKWVQIDGEEVSADRLTFTNDTWTIFGTGYTTWAGTIEKIGLGAVAIKRELGTAVSINSNTLLKISGGKFEAGGTADPFTDTTTGLSLDIENNSASTGLLISNGVKVVDDLYGTGNTTVNGPSGTELIADSIVQATLTIGAGCKVTIAPRSGGGAAAARRNITPIPEPSTWIMLAIAFAGLLCRRFRRLI